MTHTPEQIIERHQMLKAVRDARKKVLEAEVKQYDDALEALENYLLSVMIERKEVQIKTVHGTAYQSPQTRVKLIDRAALIDYAKRTGDFNFFTNAVSKEAVTTYIDANQSTPPGVEITRFTACNVRKA